jgi:hypothetical protein
VTAQWTVARPERVIRKDRARESYGEQLGCLTDVLLDVVDEMGRDSPAVLRLRAKAEEMAGGSKAAMARVRQRGEKAEADLKRLERGRGVKSALGLSPPQRTFKAYSNVTLAMV